MLKFLNGRSLDRVLFAEHPLPMLVYDAQTLRFLDVNPAASALYGYSREEFLESTVDRLRPLHSVVLPPARSGSFVRHLTKSGAIVHVQLYASDVVYQGVEARLVTAYDLTSFLETEERLIRSETTLALAQQSAHLGTFAYDRRTGERQWSDEVYRILGLEPGVAVALEGFWPFTEPSDAERVRTEVLRARSERRNYSIDHRIVRPDGTMRFVHEQGQWHYDNRGEWYFHFGTIQDISDRAEADAEIRYLAYHDPLTKTLNRSGLLERVRAAIAQREGDELVAVLCFDVNRFKTINDTLGHRTGDGVLVTAADRLASRLEPGESLGRVGADEFAIVLPRMEHVSQIARRTHHLLQSFVTPFTIANNPYSLSASVGIGVFPTDATDAEDLLRNADVAMYAAKSNGRNAFQYYSAGLREVAEQRFELERGLRRALEWGEFGMQYQPLIDADSDALVAVEALIRWDREGRRTGFPDDFIPFAERTYLIHEIGDWVFKNVLAQVQQWCAAGHSLRTWLNVSAAQLDPKLPAKLEALLSQYNVNVDCIGLELTETAFIGRDDEVLQILRDIKALGIRLALDDFGVKYSSLHYLQRLPIDVLKIDRIFVTNVNANPVNRAIIQAIIAVARELNFEVSAEGIETREEMETLKALGCDTLQGFFFGGAVSPERITGMLLGGPVR
jgi:diguanylate cyclase (GGDEF)-like protein/PAS domain S-box-containing protein